MTLFPEWLEKHKNDPKQPKRLRQMHNIYGKTEGKTCGNCIYLRRYRQSATWMKCTFSRVSGSTSTDWRAGWQACGKYSEQPDREKGGEE